VFAALHRLDGAGVSALLADALARLPAQRRAAGVAALAATLDEAQFIAAVDRIRDYIRAGDIYQVNYTWALDFQTYGDPLALYARLRAAQPVRYGALVRVPGQTILSLSPELFLHGRAGVVTAKPMKGTARRGLMPEEDSARAACLIDSDKERAENVMIVDLIRNDLGRLAAPGGVRVERLFEIETYPTVLQMTSTVVADIGSRSLGEVLRALFPCGSVTGAPKIRAMEIIAELEPGPRGLYTGALGWIAPGGDFLFNVPIRTLVIDEHGRGHLGIGSGIVADSDPAAEFAECGLKARFLTGLAPQFRLIESLRLEAGARQPYPRLDAHLRRLGDSARYFGFRFDADAIRVRLLAHALGVPGPAAHKTRLLLDAGGEVSIESSPLPAQTGEVVVKAVIAAARLDSRDTLLYHKTTHRPLYDAELARIAAIEGCFDAIFLNERGEIAEGARSNVFAMLDGKLFTPPVSAGLLDGVLRRRLVESGRAVERTMYASDLRRAEAVYLGNAVRGLMRVELLP
jgi:para-aminobenzoate synthetase/4-amino-4-deoxychorismate lyase